MGTIGIHGGRVAIGRTVEEVIMWHSLIRHSVRVVSIKVSFLDYA